MSFLKRIQQKSKKLFLSQKSEMEYVVNILGVRVKIRNWKKKQRYEAIFNSYTEKNNFSTFWTLHYLVWRQTELPFWFINKKFKTEFSKKTSDKWQLFELYVWFLFMHGDILSNLDNLFNDNIDRWSNWTLVTKIRYISWLLLNSKREKAKKYLFCYVKEHGDFLLHEFLPVAEFAYNNGVNSELISVAMHAYSRMKENKDLFAHLIKGKKVALVGNGPQEIGSASGKKIDSYDVVIRFNKFEILDKFAIDYGRKTTIWANATTDLSLQNKGSFSCYLYMPDIYSESISGRLLFDFPCILTLDILELRKKIYDETGIYCPTNGLHLIYLIKKINENFSANDCFGFSFKDHNLDPFYHHYFAEEEKDFACHNKRLECKCMREILG